MTSVSGETKRYRTLPVGMPISDLEIRPRTRSERAEAALHAAALELLAEVGYDRLTIEAVAARARASKATIYRRYTGKADLLVAALREREDAQRQTPPDTGTLRGDLRAWVGLIAHAFTGPDGAVLLGLMLAAGTDPELTRILNDRFLAAKREIVETVLARAECRGELPTGVDPALFHDVVPGVVLLRVLRRLPVDDPFLDHLVDDITLPLLRGTA
jgi:AcrR family transcriptional regulator